MVSNECDKYIYYNKYNHFKIIPLISVYDINLFEKYLIDLKKEYDSDADSTFFWCFDIIKNTIYVDSTSHVTNNDIFYQFTRIALWLFSHGYDLWGIFWYRTNKIIEYIRCCAIDKTIQHYIINDDITKKISANTSANEIITDAEKKLSRFIKNNYHNPSINIVNTEARLDQLEKRLINVKNENKFLLRLYKVIGIAAISTIIIFTLFGMDTDTSINHYHISYQ